jgi:hypothetical protein
MFSPYLVAMGLQSSYAGGIAEAHPRRRHLDAHGGSDVAQNLSKGMHPAARPMRYRPID